MLIQNLVEKMFVLFWFCFLIVLGIELRTLCVLGKCPTTEPHPQQKKKFINDLLKGIAKLHASIHS